MSPAITSIYVITLSYFSWSLPESSRNLHLQPAQPVCILFLFTTIRENLVYCASDSTSWALSRLGLQSLECSACLSARRQYRLSQMRVCERPLFSLIHKLTCSPRTSPIWRHTFKLQFFRLMGIHSIYTASYPHTLYGRNALFFVGCLLPIPLMPMARKVSWNASSGWSASLALSLERHNNQRVREVVTCSSTMR